jgi:hypothetical protein
MMVYKQREAILQSHLSDCSDCHFVDLGCSRLHEALPASSFGMPAERCHSDTDNIKST